MYADKHTGFTRKIDTLERGSSFVMNFDTCDVFYKLEFQFLRKEHNHLENIIENFCI